MPKRVASEASEYRIWWLCLFWTVASVVTVSDRLESFALCCFLRMIVSARFAAFGEPECLRSRPLSRLAWNLASSDVCVILSPSVPLTRLFWYGFCKFTVAAVMMVSDLA